MAESSPPPSSAPPFSSPSAPPPLFPQFIPNPPPPPPYQEPLLPATNHFFPVSSQNPFNPSPLLTHFASPFANPSQTPNIAHLASVKLDDTNYLLWKSQSLPTLVNYRVLGFVDGTFPCPPENLTGSDGNPVPNPGFTQWLFSDHAVLAYLKSTITRELLLAIQDAVTSRDAWLRLEKRFSDQSSAQTTTREFFPEKVTPAEDYEGADTEMEDSEGEDSEMEDSEEEGSEFDEDYLPECHCGLTAQLRLSRTDKNPYRLFYNCNKPYPKRKTCDFFQWCDEPSQTGDKVVDELNVKHAKELNLIRNECVQLHERYDNFWERLKSGREEWNKEKADLSTQLTNAKTELDAIKKRFGLANDAVPNSGDQSSNRQMPKMKKEEEHEF